KTLREFVNGDREKFLTTQHERDVETGLDYRGARFYDGDIARFLSLDPLAANFSDWSPYNYVISNPIFLVDADGQKPTPHEAALMAKHVYGGVDADAVTLTGGWRPSTRLVDGLILLDEKTSYKAKLYARVDENGTEVEYAFVIAGTAETMDWLQDGAQIVGYSTQYFQAVGDASVIDEDIDYLELTFVGHSLGGGLAVASALRTGREAITFNPAGLSAGTITHLGLTEAVEENGHLVHNYSVLGEAVGMFQGLVGVLGVVGETTWVPGPHGLFTDNYNAFLAHKIDDVIAGLELLQSLEDASKEVWNKAY
ncbi:MAG: hypothetical protein MI810_14665, partial [Flavobacteriales bacterium]|nr:hypothetical protein [Flavobacteriales bacterium]